jgi:DNA processing protein
MTDAAERCLTGSSLPGRLADLAAPPKRLFLRGELPRGPAVAIVGTRYPSARAKLYARSLAKELARAGVAVISGGAKGIDSAAHRGALAVGGATVVVAPAGFERPFPIENRELFHDVVERGGAYLSLVEAHIPANPGAFFPRNGCLVALAHVVVVVESRIRGGARNAAAHARRLGRPLFVVPAPPWHAKGRGCMADLLLGARPLMYTKDLFTELAAQNLHAVAVSKPGLSSAGPQQQSLCFSETSSLDDARSATLDAVRRGASSSDEIGLATGLPAGRVSELILTLRLEGVLVTDPCGRLQIRKLRI